MDPINSTRVAWLFFGGSCAFSFTLIGRIVYDWLSIKRNNKNGNNNKKEMLQMHNDISWVKKVMEKTDKNGVPMVYMPRGLLELSAKNNEMLFEMNLYLKQSVEVLKENGELLRGWKK